MKRSLLVLGFALLTLPVFSQLTVSGKILDKNGLEPIIGATVLEDGTSNGTVTDFEGEFILTVAEDASLSISYLGYETMTVALAGRSRLELTLSANVQQLDGVIVTAFGIEREKKAAGFSFSEIDGDDLNQAREVNVASQLVGKVAGLDIVKPSNGPAGATRITIRGLSQFQGDNRPLLVIDGVPVDNSNLGTAGLYGGRDTGDGFSSLNPDDIETITVLKGPAASALYGSRAGNGVLMITTKKGSNRRGVGVTYSTNFTTEEVTVLPNFQNEYGQGANGEKPTTQQEAFDNWRSWGARLDGSLTPIFNGEELPYSAVGQDDIRDYYQQGETWTHSLALTAGNEKANSRLSFSRLTNEGIVPTAAYQRYTINLSTQAQLTDKLSLSGRINYVIEEAQNRVDLTDNPSNPSKYFTISPANLPHEVFRQTRDELGQPIYWSNNPFTLSPYWGPLENVNEDRKNRVQGFVSARWQIINGLSAQFRASTDDSRQSYLGAEIDGTQYIPGGMLRLDEYDLSVRNYEFTLFGKHRFNDHVRIDVNGGATRTDRSFRRIGIQGRNFISPGLVRINNMAIRDPGTYTTNRERVNAIFLSTTLSINDYLYLEGSIRDDFFSTLTNPLNAAASDNDILYGSGSLSFILSDALSLPTWWSFAKLRAGYGTSGFGQIDPYSQVPVFFISPDPKETAAGNITFGNIQGDVFPNPNLKPSRTTSIELGADLNFLNNRFGLEFTYYNQRTDDHVFPSPLPASTGYNRYLVNAGEVQNQGVEVLARAKVIETTHFSWDVSLNFSRNRNKVVRLIEGIDQLNLGVDRTFSANIVAQAGGQIGDIWGNVYERNASGAIVHGDDGLPVIAADRQILGNFNPDWYGGLTSSFSYKKLSLSFLIDTKQGGEILSTTSSFGYLFGRHPNSLAGRDNPDFMIIGEGVGIDGVSPNTTAARVDNYYERISSISEENVFDASYLKFRQLTLSYSFNANQLKRLKYLNGVTLSLVGRNLFFFSNGLDEIGLDPESIYTATGDDVGIEYAALPSTRSYGVNLQVRF